MKKLIKVEDENYTILRDLKFDLRVETFNEVISILIKEHKEKQGAELK